MTIEKTNNIYAEKIKFSALEDYEQCVDSYDDSIEYRFKKEPSLIFNEKTGVWMEGAVVEECDIYALTVGEVTKYEERALGL